MTRASARPPDPRSRPARAVSPRPQTARREASARRPPSSTTGSACRRWRRVRRAVPAWAIAAATRINAQIIGKGRELGSIEPGKIADVIVVNGNPLFDIVALSHVELGQWAQAKPLLVEVENSPVREWDEDIAKLRAVWPMD